MLSVHTWSRTRFRSDPLRYKKVPFVVIIGSADPADRHKPVPSELEIDPNYKVGK